MSSDNVYIIRDRVSGEICVVFSHFSNAIKWMRKHDPIALDYYIDSWLINDNI